MSFDFAQDEERSRWMPPGCSPHPERSRRIWSKGQLLADSFTCSQNEGELIVPGKPLLILRGVVRRVSKDARSSCPLHLVDVRRWKDFGRVSAAKPRRERVQPRPESLTPVQASAGSR